MGCEGGKQQEARSKRPINSDSLMNDERDSNGIQVKFPFNKPKHWIWHIQVPPVPGKSIHHSTARFGTHRNISKQMVNT